MTDALSKVSLKYKMPIHNWLPLFLMKAGMRCRYLCWCWWENAIAALMENKGS
jgi:hypothetical protein